MVNDNTSKSKLSRDTEEFRKKLISRNLYTPNHEYSLNSEVNKNGVVNTINSIVNSIQPFKSFDLKNTVYGRLVIDDTPLAKIGLEMLTYNMSLNLKSSIISETMPTINILNLFDGNKQTKLFTPKIDYKITKNTNVSGFERFIEKITNFQPNNDNPFNSKSNNYDYIKNTGNGQLDFLINLINKNQFKPTEEILIKKGEEIQNPIQELKSKIGIYSQPIKITYSDNGVFNKYTNIFENGNILESNKQIVNNLNNLYQISDSNTLEYGYGKEFIDNLGITNKNKRNWTEGNGWIDDNTLFKSDSIENKLIWGRDGISDDANNKINDDRGLETNLETTFATDFNINGGLLDYTKNLLNATNGLVVDNTRKVYKNGDNVIGFNGSSLWKSNNSSYAKKNGFNDKVGLRQHTVVDGYDRFAKAIRFVGNSGYEGWGNENSVIYKSVVPRMHPVKDENKEFGFDNKNLMFSIENLAIQTIPNPENMTAIIDDEFGTQIPITEAGAFGGRVMWFPPYNVTFTETATAKHDPVSMLGRTEQMFNYVGSERSGTLSFTLIIDYPDNLRDSKDKKQREFAEFFAFGGDSYTIPSPTNNIDKINEDKKKNIDDLISPDDQIEPEIIKPDDIIISFLNDKPNTNEINSIIDIMYINNSYEIQDGCLSSDGTSSGINRNIYSITNDEIQASGDTGKYYLDKTKLPIGFSQYNAIGDCTLNNELLRIFGDEKNRKYFKILITGGASKLYTELNALDIKEEEEYNKKLGLRRAEATKYFVEQRIKALFGQPADKLGITIEFIGEGTTGSEGAKPENATKAAIPEEDTKRERYSLIKIEKTDLKYESKEKTPTPEEKRDGQEKQKESVAADSQSKKDKTNVEIGGLYVERGLEGDTGILNGFDSIKNNHFYPVYHSQTPEDFHKRLTFLHQCTRQGAAIRGSGANDENGVMRIKNSAFGRQPVCIIRYADFLYTKVIVENITFDYNDSTMDTNPEGFGMQYMKADITMTIKIIGGQSLSGPINALQNALSFNYYANSTFSDKGLYLTPSYIASKQFGKDSNGYEQKIEDNIKYVNAYKETLKK